MGDASLPHQVPVVNEGNELGKSTLTAAEAVREINVLVTGFGPFKSFLTNPSFLIASALPTSLEPSLAEFLHSKIPAPSSRKLSNVSSQARYKINVHVHPVPIRVSFDAISSQIPGLLSWEGSTTQAASCGTSSPRSSSQTTSNIRYDYILHVGMAAGRDYYSLETLAHRDHYRLKDVDDRDGFMAGEYLWKREGLPEVLDIGWEKNDVLSRWQLLTDHLEDRWEENEMQSMGWGREKFVDGRLEGATRENCRAICMLGKGSRASVKLSKDAGRYTCEFIFYTCLSVRWREARDENTDERAERSIRHQPTQQVIENVPEPAKERLGKAAFLHVPGGVREHDVARGVRVTIAAILALVSSWEAGYRNEDLYPSYATPTA